MNHKRSKLYRDEAMMRMRKQMDESAVFLALASPEWLDDPLCWAQLGYCLMKDKPLYLLVLRDAEIPEALKRAATRIEYVAHDEDLELATKRLLGARQ